MYAIMTPLNPDLSRLSADRIDGDAVLTGGHRFRRTGFAFFALFSALLFVSSAAIIVTRSSRHRCVTRCVAYATDATVEIRLDAPNSGNPCAKQIFRQFFLP